MKAKVVLFLLASLLITRFASRSVAQVPARQDTIVFDGVNNILVNQRAY